MRRTPEEIKAALAARRAALETALEEKKAQKRRRVTVMSHAALLMLLVAALIGGGAWIAQRATPPDMAVSDGMNDPGAPVTSDIPEGGTPPASAGDLVEKLFSFAPQEGARYELTATGSLADALPREEGFVSPAPQDQQGSEAERESAERLAKAAVEASLLPHDASLAADIGQEIARLCLAGEEKRLVYLCGMTVTVYDRATGERCTITFAIIIDRSILPDA